MKKNGETILGMSVVYGGLLIAFMAIAGLFSLAAFIFFGCKKWISKKLGIHPEVVIERGLFCVMYIKFVCGDV